MIYLDNAATTYPKPQSVRRALGSAAMYSANPGRSGHSLAMKAGENIYSCRVKAAEMFGAKSPENVIFTPGCTDSCNMVIKGLLKSGDHVVVSDMEHNAVMRPLKAMTQRGVTYTAARVASDNDETISNFREALRSSTRLVICTHVSNVWGIRLPVERLAALCRQYGILFMTDAAQSAGVFEINASESGFDFVCIPAHKGLYGTMGTGLLIVSDPQLLSTIIEGGTGSGSISLSQPDFPPDKFESGTPNYPGICALSAGLDFVKTTGIGRIHSKEISLLSELYDRLSANRNVILYTKRPDIRSCGGVMSFNVGDLGSEQCAEYLSKRGIAVRAGLHCAPLAHEHFRTEKRGAVRIAPSYFTNFNEIVTLSRVIAGM